MASGTMLSWKRGSTYLLALALTFMGPMAGAETPDWDHDVKLAADLEVSFAESTRRFGKRLVSEENYKAAQRVWAGELNKLREKYEDVSEKRLVQFNDAYFALAKPRLEALDNKYYPDKYKNPHKFVPRPLPEPEDNTWFGFIPLGMLVVGIAGWLTSYGMRESQRKYAFENTTTGGVVEFKTYADSVRFRWRGHFIYMMKMASFWLVVFGIIGIIVVQRLSQEGRL